MANGISKYAEKYLESKFNELHSEINEVKDEVKEVKTELKKNGKCLNDIKCTMGQYKLRVRILYILMGVFFLLLMVGFATGLDIFTKGIIGFIK